VEVQEEMNTGELEHIFPETKAEWRAWLEKNHLEKNAVWLIHSKQHSGKPVLSWSDAVDEALCFGWIDSKGVTVDEFTFKKYYCKRKPHSTWSKVNKEKVEKLIADDKMAAAGLNCIEVAKQNGSWAILDDVESLLIPPDLAKALKSEGTIRFRSLSKSVQKRHLQDLVLAKTKETRSRRIEKMVEQLS
jgi:uncharacterized protein YdeI (YjbR/CyaY-like superfamily)